MKYKEVQRFLQVIETTVFSILLVLVVIIAKQVIDGYLEKKTNFHSSKKPLTSKDVPTQLFALREVKD